MAYLVLVINCPNNSVSDLNNRCQDAGNNHNALTKIANVLNSINSGHLSASVQATTRDTDPSVGTHGTGSDQETYDQR